MKSLLAATALFAATAAHAAPPYSGWAPSQLMPEQHDGQTIDTFCRGYGNVGMHIMAKRLSGFGPVEALEEAVPDLLNNPIARYQTYFLYNYRLPANGVHAVELLKRVRYKLTSECEDVYMRRGDY